MRGAILANDSCGDNISCGDQQVFFAYSSAVNTKKSQATATDQAIAARIREARERLGVSMTELGLAYGGHRQTAQHWERGASFPPLSDFPKLCDLLRVTPNQLLGMDAMNSLTEKEKIAARLAIENAAMRAKMQKRMRSDNYGSQERLRRRQAGTASVRR